MPTEASSRVGFTISGNPSADRRSSTSACCRWSRSATVTARGVDTPAASNCCLALSLCNACSSGCGADPVYTRPSKSSSMGISASKRLSPRSDSHRLNTTAGRYAFRSLTVP